MAIGGIVSNCVVDPIGLNTVLTFEIDDALKRREYLASVLIYKNLSGGSDNNERTQTPPISNSTAFGVFAGAMGIFAEWFDQSEDDVRVSRSRVENLCTIIKKDDAMTIDYTLLSLPRQSLESLSIRRTCLH